MPIRVFPFICRKFRAHNDALYNPDCPALLTVIPSCNLTTERAQPKDIIGFTLKFNMNLDEC